MAAIARRLSRKTYLTQEVIFGDNEPIQPTEYTFIGALPRRMEIRFADRVSQGDVQE